MVCAMHVTRILGVQRVCNPRYVIDMYNTD